MTTTNEFSPALRLPEILNCTIPGTNLAPGNVAGDKGDSWAFSEATRAGMEYHNTPTHTLEQLSGLSLEQRAGRRLHIRAGVWVRFCANKECDAYVLTYGNITYPGEMVLHSRDNSACC